MKLLTILLLLTAMFLLSGVAQATLVGHWDFDEDATDSSGFGNDGVVHGGLQWVSDGIQGGAAYFNGQDSFIEVADSLSLDFNGSFSVATWVKLDPIQYFRVGLIKKLPATHPANGFSLHLGEPYDGASERIAAFGIMDLDPSAPLGNTGIGVPSDTALNDDQWHLIVGTYDQQTMRMYIDGILENEAVWTQGFTPNDTPLYIGNFPYAYNDGHGNLPNIPLGLMDDVRIYDNALNLSEIQQLYNPVPEPATILLLGTGLIGLAGAARKKFRSK